jgi:hypothetical protein
MKEMKRGRGRGLRGGSECAACTQTGGKMHALTPTSLSESESLDRSGGALAKQAHNLYVQQNHDLAALNGRNAMTGGRSRKRGHRRGKGRSAKKYSRRSKSKSKSRSKH